MWTQFIEQDDGTRDVDHGPVPSPNARAVTGSDSAIPVHTIERTERKVSEPQSKYAGCLPGVILLLVVIIGVGAAVSIFGGGSDKATGGGAAGVDIKESYFQAFDGCKKFVKDRLKSPSSAVFRNFFQDDGEVVVAGSGTGPYTVRSTVDSQNGFGAMLRSSFVCTVTIVDKDTVRLVDVAIG